MNFRKAPFFFATLAALPALFFLSCSKKQPVASTPAPAGSAAPADSAADTSTPKKVSLAFASAMVAGDTAAMRSMAVGTDSHVFVFYTGLSDLVAAQHLFIEALRAKFGDTCQLPPEIDHLGNLPPMPANYDTLTEQISGDTAALVDTSGHPGVRLKKVDGNWKVDFDAADAALPKDAPGQMAVQEQQFEAVKKGFYQATAKIVDGTYTDCKTAMDDVMSVLAAQHP